MICIDDMTLYRGDCLEIMQDIPDASIDMVLCDMPYGITDYEYDMCLDLDQIWHAYRRITKPSAPIVLFSAQPFTTDLISSNRKWFRYHWIWLKSSNGAWAAAKYRPIARHEEVLVFGRGTLPYYPVMVPLDRPQKRNVSSVKSALYGGIKPPMKERIYTEKYPSTILDFPCSISGRIHPSEKPVNLLSYLVKTYTKPGETVLDHCMGSGSTLHAAHQAGRKSIGIEKDETYFSSAEKRLRELASQQILLRA